MTKLDPAGEPSMDEILASIRRIIAEEPPGSRAQPEPPVPVRKEAAPVQAELPAADVAPAPAQRTEPAFTSSEFGTSPFAAVARQPEVRQPDLYPRLSPTGKREVEAIPHGGPAPNIDTQLADVLGAVRSVTGDSTRTEPTFAAPGNETAASPATNVQAAIDSLAAPKFGSPDVEPQALPARPGFTVSRDGFIPPAEQPRAESTADPFEFTLGPSPFARKPVSPVAPETQAAETRTEDPFGALVPSRDMLNIDRTLAEPAAGPAASAPFAPEARQQPDFSAMRASYAQFASPSQPKVPAEAPVESRAAFDPAPAAPAPSAFVPAAAASQPAPPPAAFSRPQPQPGLEPRPHLSGPSLSEIATPPAPARAWPPVVEPKPAPGAAPAAPPSAAFEAALVPVSAPVQDASPAFTALIFAPPAAPVAAPAAAPAPVTAREDITPPTAAATEPAAALLEQLARSSASAGPAPQPAAEPVAEPAAAVPSSSASAPAAPVHEEPAAEQVEAILEPAAEAVAPAEQDADFEDAGQETEANAHSAEPEPAPAPRALVTNNARETAAAPSANEAHTPRTMEDTVADLLRPMLRNWLSENMPRIVERALRKELEESNRSEHKSAAE